MRRVLLFLALLLWCSPTEQAQSPQVVAHLQNHAYETDLAGGTVLRLHFHDGDFRVVGSDSAKISIHAEGKNIDQAGRIKIHLQRSDNALELTLSNVPKKELQVTIEIPKSTNLYARMRGGDLSVFGVTGDKDLELTGGDLTIGIGNPEDYALVDLSVKYGDISGTQFGDPKGMVGNSLRKNGNGKYKLHAHVTAGDLMLKSSSNLN